LNDHGYLEESLEEIHARLPEELEIELDELTIALKLAAKFRPGRASARATLLNAWRCRSGALPKVAFVTRRHGIHHCRRII
jgi:RNA polymerase sigma-54 factor